MSHLRLVSNRMLDFQNEDSHTKVKWHIGIPALIISSLIALLVLGHANAPKLENKDVVVECNNASPMSSCTTSPIRRIPIGSGLFMKDWDEFLAN